VYGDDVAYVLAAEAEAFPLGTAKPVLRRVLPGRYPPEVFDAVCAGKPAGLGPANEELLLIGAVAVGLEA
jgi:hypothetical protein